MVREDGAHGLGANHPASVVQRRGPAFVVQRFVRWADLDGDAGPLGRSSILPPMPGCDAVVAWAVRCQVWLAHKESHGGVKKACAIKMPTDLIGTSALQRTAILNEARIASQLTHSNIVQVFDIGEHAGIV